MTTQTIPAKIERAVEKAASSPADSIIQRIAERLGGAANAAAVYGTAVERDGVTIIPVAKVRWGFGGGSGSGEGRTGEGSRQGGGSGEGGGGGVLATPMGYIEIHNGEAQYKQINDPMSLLLVPPIIIAGGITAWLALSGLRRLVR
jgi:uncharacterized spore protein YtfJ